MASLQLERSVPAIENRLLILNDDCLLEIFKILELDDCVNFAETYNGVRYVADFLFKYKKFSEFTVDADMINNGDSFIDRIFEHIGQHLSSLTVDFCGTSGSSALNVLAAVASNCHQLKKLEINNWHEYEEQRFADVADLDNVEMLSFYNCGDLSFVKDLFRSFKKLKFLNFCGCVCSTDLLYPVFQNNTDIKSFLHSGYQQSVDYNLFNFASKLERLCVTIGKQEANLLELNPLAFSSLTKLNLTFDGNCNNFLNRLAGVGIMEELYLRAEINDETINVIKSFRKLQSLVLETNNDFRVTSSLVWPTNIKHLKLLHFYVPFNGFISIIGQIRSLQKIDLYMCVMSNDNNITSFNDIIQLSRNIENMMNSTNSTRKLDIILPNASALYNNAGRFEKYVIDSNNVRILNDTDNEFEAYRLGDIIHFPGFDQFLAKY